MEIGHTCSTFDDWRKVGFLMMTEEVSVKWLKVNAKLRQHKGKDFASEY